jgi:uncharacterized protein
MNELSGNKVISSTVSFVKEKLEGAEGGHDWWHIHRVWSSSKLILKSEKADRLIVELGALLHDIADSKFYNGNEEIGPAMAGEFLLSLDVKNEVITHVQNIIKHISFKGGNHSFEFQSLELDVVQDADRLDALGAIGIARAFNYGGFTGRALFDPNIKPNLNMSPEEYKKATAPTINHFYEKLLTLKDRMNTETGKKLAKERHDFMLLYLDHFYEEWESGIRT